MPAQKPQKQNSARTLSSAQIGVMAVISLVVIAFVVYLVIQNLNQESFTLTGGDEAVVVLIRSDETGKYNVEYTGKSPGEIKNLQVILAGQILHVDVNQVSLTKENQEVILEKNNVPEGQQFVLNPGETFTVSVTYFGQTLGYNYMYGFRINYDDGGRNQTIDVMDKDKYLVDVE